MGHHDEFYEETARKALGMDRQSAKNKVVSTKSPLQQATELGIDIPAEMFDFIKVLVHGAIKYNPNNWLQPHGTNSSHKDMMASAFRHLAKVSCNVYIDEESGLDHALHAATRVLMDYVIRKRGIRHE